MKTGPTPDNDGDDDDVNGDDNNDDDDYDGHDKDNVDSDDEVPSPKGFPSAIPAQTPVQFHAIITIFFWLFLLAIITI